MFVLLVVYVSIIGSCMFLFSMVLFVIFVIESDAIIVADIWESFA